MNASRPRVIECPPELRAAALEVLYSHLPEDQQAGLLQAVERIGLSDTDAWDGLLVAAAVDNPQAAESIEGVIWVQTLPGNTALIWPPAAGGAATAGLYCEAAAFTDRRGIPLAQMVVAESDGHSPGVLAECGFARLAELLYLFAEAPAAIMPAVAGGDAAAGVEFEELTFLPGAGEQPERLWAVLERTYQGTQDCSALDGVRSMSDVLEGYRNQGRHLPQHWHFVQQRSADVGALLLAAHPEAGNWELMYMGVAPEARGCGIGRKMARFALDAAARGGAERLVLAVDAANEPALEAYRRVGFVEWDRRTVYARLHGARSAP